MNGIGQRIKELRKILGLTQKEFANRIGKSTISIAKWEAGDRTPDESTLKLISKEFNVSEEWLKTGEGEIFIKAKSNVITELENAIKQIEGRVPRYIKKALESGNSDEILEAITDFLYDLADEIKKGTITAETIKGNIAIGSNIEQKTTIKEK